MATITQLQNKMSGKAFRESINSNFGAINTQLNTADDNIAMLESDIAEMQTDIGQLKSSDTAQTSAVQALQTTIANLKGGYDNVLVSVMDSDNGTQHLPSSATDPNITLVGNDIFEHTTSEQNTAIQNIIKGNYIQAGDNVIITKSSSGVTISATGGGTAVPVSNKNFLVNWDWRHPSCHRGNYNWVQQPAETITDEEGMETESSSRGWGTGTFSIDCWYITFSGDYTGYTFSNTEDYKFVGYQGASSTATTQPTSWATIGQKLDADTTDFIGTKELTFSVAVYETYADYQNKTYTIKSFTFIPSSEAVTGNVGGLSNFTFTYNQGNIVLMFNNLWVQAVKLEEGADSTLILDLLKECDVYGQAQYCSRYVNALYSDGVNTILQTGYMENSEAEEGDGGGDTEEGEEEELATFSLQPVDHYIMRPYPIEIYAVDADSKLFTTIDFDTPFKYHTVSISVYDSAGNEITDISTVPQDVALEDADYGRIYVNNINLSYIKVDKFALANPYSTKSFSLILEQKDSATSEYKSLAVPDVSAFMTGQSKTIEDIWNMSLYIYYNVVISCENALTI